MDLEKGEITSSYSFWIEQVNLFPLKDNAGLLTQILHVDLTLGSVNVNLLMILCLQVKKLRVKIGK